MVQLGTNGGFTLAPRHSRAVVWTLTVLWTLKSDREAISLSSSSVADVAEGFAELQKKRQSLFHKSRGCVFLHVP